MKIFNFLLFFSVIPPYWMGWTWQKRRGTYLLIISTGGSHHRLSKSEQVKKTLCTCNICVQHHCLWAFIFCRVVECNYSERKPVLTFWPWSDIEVACYGYEGIDAVKEALRAGLSCSTDSMPIKVTRLEWVDVNFVRWFIFRDRFSLVLCLAKECWCLKLLDHFFKHPTEL